MRPWIIILQDTLQASVSKDKLATLRLEVSAEHLALQNRYTLYVKEVIKKGVKGVEPEEYRYEFEVRRK